DRARQSECGAAQRSEAFDQPGARFRKFMRANAERAAAELERPAVREIAGRREIASAQDPKRAAVGLQGIDARECRAGAIKGYVRLIGHDVDGASKCECQRSSRADDPRAASENAASAGILDNLTAEDERPAVDFDRSGIVQSHPDRRRAGADRPLQEA